MIRARLDSPNPIRRLIARATARQLQAFVVPGVEIARAMGLDLGAAGLPPAPTPRRANVLVLLGPLPPSLVAAAVVSYAQMPRPRSILAIGQLEPGNLPEPDISVGPDQESLAEGVERLRETFTADVWSAEPEPFDHELLQAADEQGGESMSHHHHHHGDHEHGGEDQRGSDPVSNDQHSGHHNHQDDHSMDEHAGHEHHEGHEENREHEQTHEQSGHGGHGGHQMDHSGHGGGFMSMIAMTQDLPRSPDELQMDWLDVPFGPLHPGLPAGLDIKLTLDGDRIAGVTASAGVTRRHLEPATQMNLSDLPRRLASLDRLAPGVYQVLAERAVETFIDGRGPGLERVIALERARLASHLGWLAQLGDVLGYRWLTSEAAGMQLEVLHGDDPSRLRPDILRMRRSLSQSFLVRRRLQGIGRLVPSADRHARGPVARAMGKNIDARCGDPIYHALGFAPVIHQGSDAFARLLVRLDEMLQSLDLIQPDRDRTEGIESSELTREQPGHASIESPRGEASIHLTARDGVVTGLHLDTPSSHHLSLIPAVSEGLELSAGLVAIVSLDISPWEVEE